MQQWPKETIFIFNNCSFIFTLQLCQYFDSFDINPRVNTGITRVTGPLCGTETSWTLLFKDFSLYFSKRL